MNSQEIFNKVYSHLLSQREMCTNGAGKCLYRFKGLKCAVGCLISDEAYTPDIEDTYVGEDKVLKVLEASGVTVTYETIKLLIRLQHLHDNEPPYCWRQGLDLIANRYALKVPDEASQ